jgi:hypothetical protein
MRFHDTVCHPYTAQQASKRCQLNSVITSTLLAGDVTVPSGTLDVSVQFMGTPIFETEWDLCGKTECPITPGDLHIHYAQTLPPITPPVRILCNVKSCGKLCTHVRRVAARWERLTRTWRGLCLASLHGRGCGC